MSRKMIDYKVEDGTITSIDGYEVGGGGTAVEANPQEEATQQLDKIKIDNITYSTGGGTNDYNDLTNKPKLGGFLKSVEISGTTDLQKVLPIGVNNSQNLFVIGGYSGNKIYTYRNDKFYGGGFPTPYPDNITRAGVGVQMRPSDCTGGVSLSFTASDQSWVCIYPRNLPTGHAGTRHFIEIPINDVSENESLKFVLDNKVPDCPTSADGTYTLKCSVSGGVATYSWVKDA